jgi:hypothetical protein
MNGADVRQFQEVAQRIAILQRLVKMHARVDEHDRHARIHLRDQSQHRCALSAEGRHIGDLPPELAHGGANDVLGRCAAQFGVEAPGALFRRLGGGGGNGAHSAAFSCLFF